VPLLKATRSTTERSSRGAVVLDLADLARSAADIVADAAARAEAIIAAASEEAGRIAEQARAEARAEGRAAGLAQGRAEGAEEARREVIATLGPAAERVVSGWEAALREWPAQRRRLLERAQEDVLEFAIALGRQVVLRTAAADGTIVADQLAEALRHIARRGTLEIWINGADRPVIERSLPQLMQAIGGCDDVRLHEDAAITRGGCVLKSGGGTVDARLESQVQAIAEALLPGRAGDGA
jgi:flagellar biosynthesis/type III secretory pathway protein FliH